MKLKAFMFGAIMAATGVANAAIISSSDSITNTTTNWSDLLTLSKFNSSLGTLNSITFNYGGTVSSSFKVERKDGEPSTVVANAEGALFFDLPLSDTLSISATASQPLDEFDGVVDFAGASGYDFGVISGSGAATQTLLSDLASYIGVGTYDIEVQALGMSSVTGGNLLAQIDTWAAASVEVIYDYTPTPVTGTTQVPEPATLGLLGLGLLGLGAASRRRSAT